MHQHSSTSWNANCFPLRGHRLLLVEDIPDAQRMLFHLLESVGANVTLECNIFAAARVSMAALPPFDAVILDLQLSVKDSSEGIKMLRQRGFNKPIIVLESRSVESELCRADYTTLIEKPFNSAVFLELISDVLEDVQPGLLPERSSFIPAST